MLYRIDPAVYQAAYDSAEASLAKTQATLATARSKAERYRQLAGTRAVAQQDLDDANAAFAEAQADVAVANAAVQSARINLDYTKITSPISGQIGRSSLTPGALVTASQTTALSTVQEIDPIYVDLTQSTASLLQLKKAITEGKLQADAGKVKVHLTLEDGTPYAEEGTIQFTDVTVDQSTGTVTVRALVPNPDHVLLPGMYVRAGIDVAQSPEAILIPQRAVTRNAQGEPTALFVDGSGKMQQRRLGIGSAVGNDWLITQGAATGDRVVIDGSQKARPGDAVRTVEVTVNQVTGLATAVAQN